jgi:hypothetical protein
VTGALRRFSVAYLYLSLTRSIVHLSALRDTTDKIANFRESRAEKVTAISPDEPLYKMTNPNSEHEQKHGGQRKDLYWLLGLSVPN